MSTVYTLRAQVAELDKISRAALESAEDAHALLDVAPKVGPVGERGLKGDAGRDAVCCCKNGADSTVPGPRGATGQQGCAGTAGKDGHDAPQRQELDALLLEYHRDIKTLRAEIADLKANVDLTRKAFTDQ